MNGSGRLRATTNDAPRRVGVDVLFTRANSWRLGAGWAAGVLLISPRVVSRARPGWWKDVRQLLTRFTGLNRHAAERRSISRGRKRSSTRWAYTQREREREREREMFGTFGRRVEKLTWVTHDIDARVTLSITRYRLVTSSGGTRATLVNRIAWIVNYAVFEGPPPRLISFALLYKIDRVTRWRRHSHSRSRWCIFSFMLVFAAFKLSRLHRLSIKSLYNFLNLSRRQMKRQTSENCYKTSRIYRSFSFLGHIETILDFVPCSALAAMRNDLEPG